MQRTRGRSQGQTKIRAEGLRKEMSADRGGEEGPGREDGGTMGLTGDATEREGEAWTEKLGRGSRRSGRDGGEGREGEGRVLIQ